MLYLIACASEWHKVRAQQYQQTKICIETIRHILIWLLCSLFWSRCFFFLLLCSSLQCAILSKTFHVVLVTISWLWIILLGAGAAEELRNPNRKHSPCNVVLDLLYYKQHSYRIRTMAMAMAMAMECYKVHFIIRE